MWCCLQRKERDNGDTEVNSGMGIGKLWKLRRVAPFQVFGAASLHHRGAVITLNMVGREISTEFAVHTENH